ncbi:MAG: DUF4442 domain-containing protein [Solirubrobacteraceae bacterium]|nr:DUF4442 domain-containing protein [Solirubrobacteraceae bacterium]
MNGTALAAGLLETLPANRSMGLEVVSAIDGVAEVALGPAPAFANVIGSLHASGLIALADAAGLAAIISCAEAPGQLEDILPLGKSAKLDFLAPARGRVVARCELSREERAALAPFLSGDEPRASLDTVAEIGGDGGVVCEGRFSWRIRRQPPVAPS